MKICALKNNYHKLYKYIYYLHFMQDIEEKKKIMFPIIQSLDLIT